MALITFVSAHGSPGVSTVAVAAAHHIGALRGVASVVLEADSDGGVLAARSSMAPSPGLAELASAARSGLQFADIERCSQRLSPHADVVLGHPGLEPIGAALRAVANPIARLNWPMSPFDLVVDAGRVRPGGGALALLASSDMVLLVVRSTAESAVTAVHRIELIERNAAAVGLVVVGDDPYSADDVASACGLPVFACLPWDPTAVGRDPLATRTRSTWCRAVRRLAASIVRECDELAESPHADDATSEHANAHTAPSAHPADESDSETVYA